MPRRSKDTRKRVIGYIKIGLVDVADLEKLVAELENFCRRHRLVLVDSVITEASNSQVKLKRLLSSIRSKRHADIIVCPSMVHFSEPRILLFRLSQLRDADIGIAFQREGLILYPTAPNTRALYEFAKDYVQAQRFAKSQAIRSSLRLASLYGRSLGKPRVAAGLRREIERNLNDGLSIRAVVKKMGSQRVSKSTVGSIRKEVMKNRRGR